MNEQVARDVVLVRAIETSDSEHAVLSDDDRNYASRSARELAAWQAAESKTSATIDHFLQQRSELILKRLAERTPAFASFARRRPILPALTAILPLIALVAGAGLDRIADPHRVDLLSAPLLLIIGWNLLVYVILIAWLFVPGRATGWARPGILRRLSVGKAALPRKFAPALSVGLLRFMDDWAALSARLTRARLSRAIHLAAACFAIGAVLSLYARGLLTQYAAGWESTFLDARQVHALLSFLFTPAMLVFPIHGFSLADIEALRFAPGASAADGARWVHLYAATLAIIVIVPRLVLAAFAHWRARRLQRRFPLELTGAYFASLAQHAGAGGAPSVLRVIPYSFTVDAQRDKSLGMLARAALGDNAQLMLRPSSPYGEDPDKALHDEMLDDPEVGVTAALFSLAATPENENHGAFIDYLLRRCPRAPAVIIDTSSFTQRGDDARLAERSALWREFCRFHRTDAQFVDLLDPANVRLELDTVVRE